LRRDVTQYDPFDPFARSEGAFQARTRLGRLDRGNRLQLLQQFWYLRLEQLLTTPSMLEVSYAPE